MTEHSQKPDWYLRKREQLAEALARSAVGETTVHLSPSGSYRLEVAPFAPEAGGYWGYTRGRVIASDGRCIADVVRNYAAFPFSWCENHHNGHSYLVCGEDYQCQTVIELDTGRRVDHVDPSAELGGGFCWAAHYPTRDGRFMFVDGCIWAGPYELVLFDFCQPFDLPYRELRRWPVWEVQGFRDDGSFVFEILEEVRISDGKPVAELPAAEQEALDNAPEYSDVIRERTRRVTWRPDLTVEIDPLA